MLAFWFIQYPDWIADQEAHGVTDWKWYPDYWTFYWAKIFEGWQSEFVQTLTLIWFSKYLIEKHSAESKDDPQQSK